MKIIRPLPHTARSEINALPPRSGKIGRTGHLALVGSALLLTIPAASAQFEITSGTGNTAQGFNTLDAANAPWTNDTTLAPGDSTLEGWSLFNYLNGPILDYNGGDGSSGTGHFYSFGLDTDRALGGVASANTYFGNPAPGSGATAGYMAFGATNNSGLTLTSFTLGFAGEQWRNANASVQNMRFEYGLGTDFASVPAWQAPGGSFDWGSVVTGGTAAAVDGNVAGRVPGLGGNIGGLSWTNGTTLWLRWIEVNDPGTDHGLGIDDFSFAWMAGTPPKTLTWTPGASAVWDSSTPNWTDGAAPATFAQFDAVNFTNAGLAAGSTVTVQAAGVNPGPMNVSNTTGTYTFTGGPIGGSGILTKTGAGALVLSTSYGGAIVIGGGSLRTTASNLLSDSGSINIAEGSSLNLDGNSDAVGSLSVMGASIATGVGALTVNGNILVSANSNGVTSAITGNLSLGSTPRVVTVEDGTADTDLALDAAISGTGRVRFTGLGIVRLNADNSGQTGGFQFDNAVGLILGNPNALGSTQVFLNTGRVQTTAGVTGPIPTPISLGGSPVFTGTDLELAGEITFFGTGAKILTTDSNVLISGNLKDSPPAIPPTLSKAGLGTLTLSGANSGFSGPITIDRGTLIAASADALGTGGLTINPSFFGETNVLAVSVSTTMGPLFSFSEDPRVRLGTGPASPTPIILTLAPSATASGSFLGAIVNAGTNVGGVTIAGAGVQILGGANTYTGPTRVDSGSLIVAGSLSGTSGVNVAAGGVLGGSGAINLAPAGSVVVAPAGILAPQGEFTPTGVLDVVGQPLALPSRTFMAAGAVFQLQLGSPNPGGTANPANATFDDGLNLTGTISLDAATLDGSLVAGFENALNDLFFLVFNDGVDPITGTFVGLPQGSTLSLSGPEGSATFAVSYTGDSTSNAFTAANGNDFVLRALTVVPEPGTVGLLTVGALGLAIRRRRRIQP